MSTGVFAQTQRRQQPQPFRLTNYNDFSSDDDGSIDSSNGGCFASFGSLLASRLIALNGKTPPNDSMVPGDTDDLLSRDIAQLSLEERALAMEEVHGISRSRNKNNTEPAHRNEGYMTPKEKTSTTAEGVDDDDIDIEISQPDLINCLLEEMETTINQTLSKVAYDFAKAQNPAFVQDREFRLGFLRSERYNARNAASRMVRE